MTRETEPRFISVSDPLYAGELELRYRVLREPLGLSRDEVASPFESESLHLVAYDGAAVVGCVLFHAESETSGRLFQMAVDPRLQGAGIGLHLVHTLEATLTARGFRHVHLHARRTAVGFYERLGYSVCGPEFSEVGLPHLPMQRQLKALGE